MTANRPAVARRARFAATGIAVGRSWSTAGKNLSVRVRSSFSRQSGHVSEAGACAIIEASGTASPPPEGVTAGAAANLAFAGRRPTSHADSSSARGLLHQAARIERASLSLQPPASVRSRVCNVDRTPSPFERARISPFSAVFNCFSIASEFPRAAARPLE